MINASRDVTYRVSRVKHSMRILCSFHLVELENLLDSKIKVGRVNSIELKFDSTITLTKLIDTFVFLRRN